MEKIDLTKCNNLRYKAKIDGNDDHGRICVENADTGLAFLRSDKEDGYVAVWHCDMPSIDGYCGRKVTDFEIVPRDPETYKDWQVGDKVCEEEFKNARYEVIFRSGELVVFKDWNNWASNPMTCSEAFARFGMRLVLTDIEQQIIKESKKYEPQDGDIVAWKDEEDDGDFAITIYRGNHRGYFTLFVNGKSMGDNKYDNTLDMNIVRPATDEEKHRLFDAMAKQGKRWNAEKKMVEDIPKPYEFKKGEPVLVRTGKDKVWVIRSFLTSNPDLPVYETSDGLFMSNWRYCIPYNERTMHLLGTSEDYKEEQR